MIKKLAISFISLVFLGVILFLIVFKINLKPVSDNTQIKEIIIEKGATYSSIAPLLKENNLIRSELFYKIYIKLNNPPQLEAGKYNLSESYSLEKIINILSEGSNYNSDTITITFIEGKNMRYIVSQIEKYTTNSANDVYELLDNQEYLDELISKYWFLTEDIKNKEIYYSLEGYLFPETYEFLNKDVSVKTIFDKMLTEFGKRIEPYKEDIEKSNYNIHELITLASIIELEGASSKDRSGVSGVFYNRLKDNWTLGSDVTTFYAEKMDNWSVGLNKSQLEDCNAYNTRGTCFTGLPVGPICNPGLESLISTFEPEQHKYYFFVADCAGKTYLTSTNAEHEKIIKKLKNENNWCEN